MSAELLQCGSCGGLERSTDYPLCGFCGAPSERPQPAVPTLPPEGACDVVCARARVLIYAADTYSSRARRGVHDTKQEAFVNALIEMQQQCQAVLNALKAGAC
jgi:hypothetical protein